MRDHLLGIDHAVILTRDLERARETYARLGFALTPRGDHTLGSQNHCIMFERDYLELMAVPKPHPALRYFTEFLAKGEGLGAIALATDDASAAQAGFVAAGIDADPPLEFSRPVKLADGVRDAAFRIVQLPLTHTPGCRMFLCQHLTREVVWRPEFQRHPNGATAIAALAVIADELHRTAARYAELLGAQPTPIAEGLLLQAGGTAVAVVSRWKIGQRLKGAGLPLRARPLVAALFLRVADRAFAASQLRQRGFAPVTLKDGSLAVDAEQACGVTLVFG